MNPQSFQKLRFIFGDQLNAEHSWFQTKSDDTLYVMAELQQEGRYVKHHIQKLCAFFSAMRGFVKALEAAGHKVLYISITDDLASEPIGELFKKLVNQYQVKVLEYQHTDEYRLQSQLEAIHLPETEVHCVDSEHFLLPFEEITDYFAPNKHLRMENFYRKMRKRFAILMDGDKPYAGQWNFDKYNRDSFKASDIAEIPEPLVFENPIEEILADIKKAGLPHFGRVGEHLLWPVTRQQSLKLLEHFCEVDLHSFGRFQDAMTGESEHAWSLYHSRLSFAINTKMLHPLGVVHAVLSAYHTDPEHIDLAQVEGFIRQIIGWREYVRGIYWVNMPAYAKMNQLQAKRPLPSWFWDGKTKMRCLSQAIQQSLEYAYAHHIQRLMVTGNFSLIAGLDPDEVDEWYLGIYIDAIEWVEMPNTRGMVLHADDGIIATKPYAASGNYINKMSDYCKACHYNVKKKTGENACPLNSLYWDFIDRHSERFKNNPRMAFPYKNWMRQSLENKNAIRQQANRLLENINEI